MNALAHSAPEPMIDARAAAKMLGIHVNTLMNKVKAREIPHMRIGTRVLFLASVLDEWRREHIRMSTPCVAAQTHRRRA
jgi:excisionase family DNA binding protein